MSLDWLQLVVQTAIARQGALQTSKLLQFVFIQEVIAAQSLENDVLTCCYLPVVALR